MPDDGTRDATNDEANQTRRRLLKSVGAAGAAGLAGCAGGGDGDEDTPGPGTPTPTETPTVEETPTTEPIVDEDDDTETPTPTETEEGSTPTETEQLERVDFPLRMQTRNPPKQGHLSPEATGFPAHAGVEFFASTIRFSITSKSVHTIDAESWEFDLENDEFRMTLKDMSWSVGDEIVDKVTAEDLVFLKRFNRAIGGAPSTILQTDWEARDEKTYVAHLNGDQGYNPRHVLNQELGVEITHYREGPYKAKLEAIQDATTEDEKDEIRGTVSEITQGFTEKPVSGVWKPVKVTGEKVVCNLKEEHWQSDHLNFNTMEWKYPGGAGSAGYQAMAQGDELDCIQLSEGIPTSVCDPPSHVREMASKFGGGWPQGLSMNFGGEIDPMLGKKNGNLPQAAKMRQGIAYALDADKSRLALWGFPAGCDRPVLAGPVKKIHGLRDKAQVDSVDPNMWSKLPSYEQDLEKAAELWESQGMSKQKGTWIKPNGEVIELVIDSFPWTRGIVVEWVDQLKKFGMQAEHAARDSTTGAARYWSDRTYQASAAGGPAQGSPSIRLNARFNPDEWIPNRPPTKWKVPPEIGDMEGDPTMTVDAAEITSRFQTTPESELTEGLKKLMWVYAYYVPIYNVMIWPQATPVNKKHFSWPKANDSGQFSQNGVNHNPIYGITHNRVILGKGGAPGMGERGAVRAREQ